MAEIIDDNFMVCTDCLMAIANDDYTGLDYHYNDAEAEQRMNDIKAGIDNAGGHIALGDSENDAEFSISACDCCSSSLAGSRHHCVILS